MLRPSTLEVSAFQYIPFTRFLIVLVPLSCTLRWITGFFLEDHEAHAWCFPTFWSQKVSSTLIPQGHELAVLPVWLLGLLAPLGQDCYVLLLLWAFTGKCKVSGGLEAALLFVQAVTIHVRLHNLCVESQFLVALVLFWSRFWKWWRTQLNLCVENNLTWSLLLKETISSETLEPWTTKYTDTGCDYHMLLVDTVEFSGTKM